MTQRRDAARSRAPTRPATRMTAPIVIHGNPSPRVGRWFPLPPAVTGLKGVDVEVVACEEVDDEVALAVGGVVV